MANSISVSIDSRKVSEALEKLRGVRRRAVAAAQDTVATYGLLIESTAKELAPVDTGALRAATVFEIDASRLRGKIENGLIYAPRIEFGFIGTDARGRRYTQPAQPFMFPAAERWRVAYVAAMKKSLQNALK